MTTRTVRVIQRFNGGWSINILPVTVEWVCPQCGQPRGEPSNLNFCEDGEWFSCDRWDNPCGHVDMYADVIAESRREMQQGRAK